MSTRYADVNLPVKDFLQQNLLQDVVFADLLQFLPLDQHPFALVLHSKKITVKHLIISKTWKPNQALTDIELKTPKPGKGILNCEF